MQFNFQIWTAFSTNFLENSARLRNIVLHYLIAGKKGISNN